MKILFLIMSLAGVLTFTGCSSPQKTAYVATGTTVVSVETGLKIFNDHVALGKVSVTDEKKVRAAYELYQQNMRLLRITILASVDNPRVEKDVLERVITTVEASRNELLQLIATLTKK